MTDEEIINSRMIMELLELFSNDYLIPTMKMEKIRLQDKIEKALG